jgi:hypothetical protein
MRCWNAYYISTLLSSYALYYAAKRCKYKIYFMSFCCILSTLWSQAAFHNIPHFSHGQEKSGIKVQCKIAVAVQKVKTPVHFIQLF